MSARTTRGLRIATRCTSIDQFIAAFHRFCDDQTCFISTLTMRPVGLETAFSIDLAHGAPALRGLGIVVEAWPTPGNRYGRPGLVLGLRKLTADSEQVFARLLRARADGSSTTIPPPTGSSLVGPLPLPTVQADPMRTPGSELVLPANPLMNISDHSLEGFVDCTLYEETGNFFPVPDTESDAESDAPADAAVEPPVLAPRRMTASSPVEPNKPNKPISLVLAATTPPPIMRVRVSTPPMPAVAARSTPSTLPPPAMIPTPPPMPAMTPTPAAMATPPMPAGTTPPMPAAMAMAMPPALSPMPTPQPMQIDLSYARVATPPPRPIDPPYARITPPPMPYARPTSEPAATDAAVDAAPSTISIAAIGMPRRSRSTSWPWPKRRLAVAGAAAVATIGVALAIVGHSSSTPAATARPPASKLVAVNTPPTRTASPLEAPSHAVAIADVAAAPATATGVAAAHDDEAADPAGSPTFGSGPCKIAVSTTPAGSIVSVDGEIAGPSPITIGGPCARRKLDIAHPRYQPTTRVVMATPQAAAVDVALARPTHDLYVETYPAGAVVSIDGHRAGTSPTLVKVMGFTTLSLRIEKFGFRATSQKIYSKSPHDHVSIRLGH